MKKIIILLTICFVSVTSFAASIKEPDLAGAWYPANKETLSSVLDSYLNEAKFKPIDGDIIGIIAPHAGIIYSGPVAAYSYKAVSGRAYKTVIILGFSHRKSFKGLSIYKDGYFATPLGNLACDSEITSDIIAKAKNISFNPDIFVDENSVELQLPFIKKVLPDTKIVPIAFGLNSYEDCKAFSEVLSSVLKKYEDVLLVASTDMSHDHRYEDAQKIDLKSADLLKNFAAQEIFQKCVNEEQIYCGYMPVVTLLLTAKKFGANELNVLQYSNSGNVTGDTKSVVGYISAVVYKSRNGKETKGGRMLDDNQRKKLLKIARDAIMTYLETGSVMEVKEDDPVLNKEMGAFVTLHKRKELRGCIGNIIGRGPLYKTVRDMAIESAVRDPRFEKVRLGEMKDIDIEISALSELEKVSDVNSIKMGVHGVLVRKGFSSGVFLPQVATETGWAREEFLSNLCAHKAGLSPDAWKYKGIDIYIFTAEVFGEK